MRRRIFSKLCLLLACLTVFFAVFGCTSKPDVPAGTGGNEVVTTAGGENTAAPGPAPKEPKRECRFSNLKIGGVALGDYMFEGWEDPKNGALGDWLYGSCGINRDAESDHRIVAVDDPSLLYNEVLVEVTDCTVYLISSAHRNGRLAVFEFFRDRISRCDEDEVEFPTNRRTWEPEDEASAPSYRTATGDLHCEGGIDRSVSSYTSGDTAVFACTLYAGEQTVSCTSFEWSVRTSGGSTVASGSERGKFGVMTVRVPIQSGATLIFTVNPKNEKGETIMKEPFQTEASVNVEAYSKNSFWLTSVLDKPTVFAVEDSYRIFVPTEPGNLMWAEVDGVRYYDASNGIARSDTYLHKMTVPMEALNRTGTYRIYKAEVTDRKAYNSVVEPATYEEYSFSPVDGNDCNIYQIADAHGLKSQVLKAAEYYKARTGEIDLLVLNGDLISTSEDLKVYNLIYQFTWEITKGGIPVIFSRGNHDLRGKVAEQLSEYTPVSSTGKTYYTVHLGSLWGIVVDAGEDKYDDHPEYGGTVACHQFRLEQTAFIKSVIANRANEYEADGVEHRVIISHYYYHWNRYQIETEIYDEWVALLNQINADVALQGHYHEYFIHYPGETLTLADGTQKKATMNYPVVIGSKVNEGSYFAGCGLQISGQKMHLIFSDPETIILEKVL